MLVFLWTLEGKLWSELSTVFLYRYLPSHTCQVRWQPLRSFHVSELQRQQNSPAETRTALKSCDVNWTWNFEVDECTFWQKRSWKKWGRTWPKFAKKNALLTFRVSRSAFRTLFQALWFDWHFTCVLHGASLNEIVPFVWTVRIVYAVNKSEGFSYGAEYSVWTVRSTVWLFKLKRLVGNSWF